MKSNKILSIHNLSNKKIHLKKHDGTFDCPSIVGDKKIHSKKHDGTFDCPFNVGDKKSI